MTIIDVVVQLIMILGIVIPLGVCQVLPDIGIIWIILISLLIGITIFSIGIYIDMKFANHQ